MGVCRKLAKRTRLLTVSACGHLSNIVEHAEDFLSPDADAVLDLDWLRGELLLSRELIDMALSTLEAFRMEHSDSFASDAEGGAS